MSLYPSVMPSIEDSDGTVTKAEDQPTESTEPRKNIPQQQPAEKPCSPAGKSRNNCSPFVHPRQHETGREYAETNVEPRFELFLLGEGEKKVTVVQDTRKSFSTITIFTTDLVTHTT